MQPILPPQAPDSNDPHDENVEDDSLLRPVSTPPERDRAQADFADTDTLPSETMTTDTSRSAIPMVPLVILAVLAIALLLYWLM